MRAKIRAFLNHQIVEKIIIGIIFLNLFFLVLASVDDIKVVSEEFFYYFDSCCVFIFTIEYVLRIISAKSYKEFFRPMMIIDLLAILPFYLSTVFDGSAIFLRILRLSKLLRLLKLARYSAAMMNLKNAFKAKKEELVITFMIFIFSVFICGVLMYTFEHNLQPEVFSSIPRACYFAVITFTTVGYGDFSPLSEEGRVVAMFMSIGGVCIHGLFVGVIGSAIMSAFKLDKNEGN